MKTSNIMKIFAPLFLIVLGGASAAFAQNETINGSLTVQQDVFLNSISGNTYVNGNTTFGGSNADTLYFKGIAGSGLTMANQSINNVQTVNLGTASNGQFTPVTGLINFYSSTATTHATIFAANQTSNFLYTIPNAGASASFVMTQGAQTINGGKTFSSTSSGTTPLVATNSASGGTALSVTSGKVNIGALAANKTLFTDASHNLTTTGLVAAGSGGTGDSTYNTGDMLYAGSPSPTSLSKLPIGAANRVLTVSGSGVPAWENSGATIIDSVVTSTFNATADQDPFTPAVSASYIRINNQTDSGININSIDTTGISNGRLITLANVSASTSDYLVIQNEAGVNAGEQILLPSGNIILGRYGTATFIYDGTFSKWTLVSTN